MQVDRGVVEERVTRELYERVLPLVERERVALSITAGASLDEQVPFAAGSAWGPPWGTTWFLFTGVIPEHWAGSRVEAIIDLGFRADAAGFQCEGLIVDEAGQLALADVLAVGTAARSLVLLGDPNQLPQVSQGSHPEGSGLSVLAHLLGGEGLEEIVLDPALDEVAIEADVVDLAGRDHDRAGLAYLGQTVDVVQRIA